jgi:hypothetical protein
MLTCANRGRGTHVVPSANISPGRDTATAASRPHHTHILTKMRFPQRPFERPGEISTPLRMTTLFTCAHVNNLMGVAKHVFLLRNMPSSRAALNTSFPCATQCILHFSQTIIHFTCAHVSNALHVAPATPHLHISLDVEKPSSSPRARSSSTCLSP